MDLRAVMDEIATRLDTIDGLRVHKEPPETVSAPAAIVVPPETLTYDATYGRGMDRMDPGVVVLIGKVTARSAYKTISDYCRGSGPRSFKQVLEAEPGESYDTLRVASVQFETVTMSGVDYLSATFTLDITGQGA